MQKTFFLALIALVFFFQFACEKNDPTQISADPNNSINQIMSFGDSRVQGGRPSHESYRFPLWKLLIENQYTFDFIGEREDDQTYPSFMGQSFDRDHQSQGGATTVDVERWLEQITGFTPDIVLLGIGGNDLLDGEDRPTIVAETVARIGVLVDDIRAMNPDVVILLEQIAPGRSDIMTPNRIDNFKRFNEGVGQVAAEKSSANSPVVVIDMTTDWDDRFMADAVHYNEAGAARVAQHYYDALVPYLQR